MNKNSEFTFIFPEIPVKALCLMLQSLNQPTLLLVHIVLACWLLTETVLVNIIYYVFLSSKHLALFSKLAPYNTKSSPFQLLSSSKFCCTWRVDACGSKYKCPADNSINKKYWIFTLELWQNFLCLVWNIVVRKFLKMLYKL